MPDEVVISGKTFKTEKTFSSDFVGEEVSAYIRDYGKTDEVLVAMFTTGKKSENIMIEAENILDKTNFTKYVYDEKNKVPL